MTKCKCRRLSLYSKDFFYHHVVFQQGRMRVRPSVKTFRSPLFNEFGGHCVLSVQLNAALRLYIRAKNIKILEWESNPQSVAFADNDWPQYLTIQFTFKDNISNLK